MHPFFVEAKLELLAKLKHYRGSKISNIPELLYMQARLRNILTPVSVSANQFLFDLSSVLKSS